MSDPNRSPPAARRVTPMSREDARASLTLYLGLVVVLTGAIQAYMIFGGVAHEDWGPLLLMMMWIPGLSGIATRLIRGETFADLGLRLGGWRSVRWLLLLAVLPTLICVPSYGLAWLTDLATFQLAPATRTPELEGAALFATRMGLLPVNILLGVFFAAGEELGWRGTMLNRLVDAEVPRPVLVSGVIWALWHMPLLLAGGYAAGSLIWLSALLFLVTCVVDSVIMARVQWRTGTVWAACVYHSAWNATIQGVFDRATDLTPAAKHWVSESGVLVVGVALIIALVFFARGVWTVKRHPADPEEPLGRKP